MNHRYLSIRCSGLLCALALLTGLAAPTLARSRQSTVLEPWPGLRPILLLPLELGPNWNVDRAYGQALVPGAAVALEKELRRTGKLSVIVGHRYSPLLRRAVQEKKITQEELVALVDKPSLETARAVLDKIRFDVPPGFTSTTWPLIGVFHLEEVRAGSGKRISLQVQVSGSIYEPDNPVAVKTSVVTSAPVSRGGTNYDRILLGATDSFQQVAEDFVQPVPDIDLPGMVKPAAASAMPAGPVTPAPAEPPPVTAPVEPSSGVTLPGDVPIAGASSRGSNPPLPRLPAPKPPLGITVPDVPAVQ